jgi:glycosyltransferase involved in cell wall biosynthesis
MLFSVLIAHYNNSKYLARAIDSVLNQTHTNWEIVLVDDGSTDHFDDVVHAYSHDGRIRIFRNGQNHGCGYTKRLCAAEARGSILGFLDPDDALVPQSLERMVLMHRLMPEYSLVHSTHYICNEELKPSRIAEYTGGVPAGTTYLLLGDGRIHHFASFKREHYRKTRGISPDYRKAVDQDLYYLLEEQGGTWYLDEPLYLYRIHPHSISTSGKESDATLWHYLVIRDACLRRMERLSKTGGQAAKKDWRLYRTRFLKISILEAYRRKKWLQLPWFTAQYLFTGGGRHMATYLRKIMAQGPETLRRTFQYDHKIEP